MKMILMQGILVVLFVVSTFEQKGKMMHFMLFESLLLAKEWCEAWKMSKNQPTAKQATGFQF